MPVEVEVIDRAQHGDGVVKVNRFQRHPAAPHVHVRLERVDPGRTRQAQIPVVSHDRIRRDLELVVRNVAERQRADFVLRLHIFRVEDKRDLALIEQLLPDCKIMHVEADSRAGLEQTAGVLVEGIPVLADGILVQLHARFRPARRRIGFDRVGHDVVHDAPGPRTDFHRLDPAIFGETGVGEIIDPPVRTGRVHLVRSIHLHDEVRLTDMPDVFRSEVLRPRHVGEVAGRRTRVGPLHHLLDFLVGQRKIVLVLADAHGLVEMPWRHLAAGDALPDRTSPRACLLIRSERHRRGRAGVVAPRAFGLEDRRDVLREGDGGGELRGPRGRRTCDPHGCLDVRPAAVIPEIPSRFARAVVNHREQRVLARLAERGAGGCLPIHDGLLHCGERDLARAAVLRPLYCHARRFLSATFLRQAVVGRRHVQRDRAADGDRRRIDCNLRDRRGIRIDVLAVAAAGRAQAIDLPHSIQRAGH